LYRNNSREKYKENTHYIQVQLKGTKTNSQGFGAWIEIFYDNGKKQIWENTPFRGYLSTVEDIAHFGLGKIKTIDSLSVKWQNGRIQVLRNIPSDQLLTIDIENSVPESSGKPRTKERNSLFREITDSLNIHFIDKETDFVDFNIQKLIPHKFSEYGPALAVGDIDGNGFEDIVCGGSANNSAHIFLQQGDGRFIQKSLLPDNISLRKSWDDTGILLIDADRDGDLDLFIASGGYENQSKSPLYEDHFYVNDGKGNFSETPGVIPSNTTSKFCVRAADIDKDGDLDLFIAGRVDPWNYPKPVSSFIYRNDSKPGHIKFTDITPDAAKDLLNIGLVCDALFTDFDNDGWPDLILAGEWMPVTMFKNVSGIFKNITNITGTGNQTGWWNSISAGDFDNDGDIDYIVGNLGLNSFYKSSEKYPVSVYAKDFDNNGSYDAFTTIWLPASQQDTIQKEYPVNMRDDVIKQMIGMRSKFQNYKSFALATIDQVFSKDQLKNALILRANNFNSSYLRNDGNDKFNLSPLPAQAELSTITGMTVEDYDGDGNLDVILNGNDWGTEVSVGRYDALNGLFLRGDGKGVFTPLSIAESGIYIPGNGKALVGLMGKNDHYLLAAGQNRGTLKVFRLKRNMNFVKLLPDDVSGVIAYKNGISRKIEFYYGCSFLSQSGRFLNTDDSMKSVIIANNSGARRKIDLESKKNP
jgi:hypothetical protein